MKNEKRKSKGECNLTYEVMNQCNESNLNDIDSKNEKE